MTRPSDSVARVEAGTASSIAATLSAPQALARHCMGLQGTARNATQVGPVDSSIEGRIVALHAANALPSMGDSRGARRDG
jgi:hypothetical protein